MRFYFLLLSILPLSLVAQIGIGTSSVNGSAQLQVESASKGFLPPRVALKGTDDATQTPPTISNPTAGLLVYNTANVTGAAGVTPGYYFFDGSKWQRLINQQPDATVEFTSPDNDPNNAGASFTGTPVASGNVIYVSTTDGSQWTWNGSAYITYTPPASTAWFTAGGTTDAGSNKSGSIYRTGKVAIGGTNATPNATLDIRTNPTSTTDPGTGFLGIGTTTALAPAAGAGAIRYNTGSGGLIQYSNGVNWNDLTATTQKTVVTGYFSGTYSPGLTTLTCTEESDVTGAFSSNTFTAPRTGLYLITANLLPVSKNWNLKEEFNIIFHVGGNDLIVSPYFSPVAQTDAFGGTSITAVISLTANQTASFRTFNNGSITNYALYGPGYNRFSITEL